MKNPILFLFLVASHWAVAQTTITSPDDLKNWLPATFLGFSADPDSYAAELTQDNRPYFLAAKKYTKESSVVSIVVFDYRKVSERIQNASNAWTLDKKIDEETIHSAHSMVAGCKAQEFFDKKSKTAQVYLYHANRYLITISSSTEDVSLLKTVAESLQPTKLPN